MIRRKGAIIEVMGEHDKAMFDLSLQKIRTVKKEHGDIVQRLWEKVTDKVTNASVLKSRQGSENVAKIMFMIKNAPLPNRLLITTVPHEGRGSKTETVMVAYETGDSGYDEVNEDYRTIREIMMDN